MPKPDLTVLTGGYRRTPVLQIGANVYCDTHCIVHELERRVPKPTLYPRGFEGVSELVSIWADRTLWPVVVQVAFGAWADVVSEEFIQDRTRFTDGRMTREALKLVYPAARDQLRAHLAFLERQFADGRLFLLGDAPSIADFATVPLLRFLQTEPPGATGMAPGPTDAELKRAERVLRWMDRVQAIGHGECRPMDAKEALEVCRAASTEIRESVEPGAPNVLRPGDPVTVVPDDYGRDPVAGEMVSSSVHEIAVRRRDERVGEVVVHFPRTGFYVFRT